MPVVDPYSPIEELFVTLLSADDGPLSKFGAVQAYGAELSDEELVAEIKRMSAVAPAALVMNAGGDCRDEAQQIEETVNIAVILVAAAGTRAAALRGDASRWGLNRLAYWVEKAMHGQASAAVTNRIEYVQRRPFVMPHSSLGVAALMVNFRTLVCL